LGIEISATVHGIARCGQIATRDGIKQRWRGRKIGIVIGRDGFWRAARGQAWQSGRARSLGAGLAWGRGELCGGGCDFRH
jgi:hypothetical protein